MSSATPSGQTVIYDTIIIGGGPAGAACAYDLARSEKAVLIIEKAPFPRFKPCAGMLTMKALHQLPYSIAPIVQWKSGSITLTRNFKAEKTISASKEVVVTTVRSELDEFSLNKAIQAGAELQVFNKGFQSYQDDNGILTIVVAHKGEDGKLEQSQFKTHYLVGADGAHSKVRKQSKQFVPDRTAIALEGRIPLSKITNSKSQSTGHREETIQNQATQNPATQNPATQNPATQNPATQNPATQNPATQNPATQNQAVNKELRFDFDVAKKGYGWLIPKGDHINVGLYTRRPDQYPISKTQLQDYTEKLLGTREIDELQGFPVGTGGEHYNPSRADSVNKLLLVGDAAGMAEPIFGEGIHNAIKSGRAAAQAIKADLEQTSSQDLLSLYMEQLEAVVTDVWWCRQIARPFYKCLPPALAILQRRPVRITVMEGFSDGFTIKECLKQMSPMHSAKPYPSSKTMDDLRAQVALK